ncbi:cytochrome P450 [Hoeflea sp. G2-23]|uniref:Cytochrome P450 n=1 Tax=Hoeflea algicola TaxID=2983763 RepID=A0ABT3Z393_9HYPH|nr:cytochrome P450 [Hoeflea algicola]MCY0146189.1 cytochrome P450 [Hoeflea algicola]
MNNVATIPFRFGRLRSLSAFAGILADPLAATRRLHGENGPYVILQYPHSRSAEPQLLPLVADSGLYRTIASNAEVWRAVNVSMRSFKNTAASRLATGFTRLRGPQHAHYRRLVALTVSKPAVSSMSPKMAALAMSRVASWPRNLAVDLMPAISALMQDQAIGLLFGGDRERALPVAAMIGDCVAAAWPLPGRAYIKWLRTAPRLERAINEWAEHKRGELNPKDIFSVLVNNMDENGNPPDKRIIGGILNFTFGAAYDTAQNALAWTLLLLTQHPEIAARLTDEIDGALAGSLPTMDKIDSLPLLEGVVREGMRLFPPVPLQFRRSLVDTRLGGAQIPAGTRVMISAWLINRTPELYSEPERFMPERWQALDPAPFQYPVFGAGVRMCPGVAFGNQMTKIALAAILSSYRIELAPQAAIGYRTTITLTPHPALPIVLREKSAPRSFTPLSGPARHLVQLETPA